MALHPEPCKHFDLAYFYLHYSLFFLKNPLNIRLESYLWLPPCATHALIFFTDFCHCPWIIEAPFLAVPLL